MIYVMMFLLAIPLATAFIALIYWLAGKVSGSEPREPPSSNRLFAAWIITCAIMTWGWFGDGAPFGWLLVRFAAAGVGVWIVRAIVRQRMARYEDADTFR
jgi:hypothetical protein